MPEKPYEVLDERRTGPSLSAKGFFCDFMASNYTCQPVVLVDIFNRHHTVAPVSKIAGNNGLIELVYRSTDVPRTDPTQRYTTLEQPITAKCIKLDTSQLSIGPIYVEEVEVVICTVEQAPGVVHPKSTSVYDNTIRKASITLAQQDNFPTLRLFANDPSGVLTELYAYMFGAVVKTPVTSLINREASITIVITSCGQVVYQKSYSLGEFLNKNKFIADRGSPVLCIGTSRLMVEQYAKAKEREMDSLPEDELKRIKLEAEFEASKKQQKTISDLESKLQTAQWETQQAQQQQRLLAFQLAEQKRQYDVASSQLSGYKSLFDCKGQQDVMTRSELQTEIVREKSRQAQIASDTERVKQSEIVWKVVGGAVIAIGTALITSYLKEKK